MDEPAEESDPGHSAGALRRLTDVSRALTYARSLDEVLDLTVDCAADLLGAPRVILMLNGPDDRLQVRASRGVDSESVRRFREPLDETILVRLSGLLGPDAEQGFLGVPLVVAGRVTGLLGVQRPEGPPPADEGEWLLSALADQAAVALENARHRDARSDLEGRVSNLEQDKARREQAMEILSHDLRSPLNAILGYVSLLQNEVVGSLTDRQRETLERIEKVGEHFGEVLANVLEMARLTGGEVAMEMGPVDVAAVARGALDVVRPAAESAGIELTAEGSDVPEIRSDGGRLRQVLVQLLDNAIKYSPDGSKIGIRWRLRLAPPGNRVEIAVEDEGPGIEPERQEAIFEPYVRKDGDTARGRTGVGLGLSIAVGLVSRLGGSLSLESARGEGSVFRLWLPADEEGEA